MKKIVEKLIEIKLLEEKTRAEQMVVDFERRKNSGEKVSVGGGYSLYEGGIAKAKIEEIRSDVDLLHTFGMERDIDQVLKRLQKTVFPLKAISRILDEGSKDQVDKMFADLTSNFSEFQGFILNYLQYKQDEETLARLFTKKWISLTEKEFKYILSWTSAETASVVCLNNLTLYSSIMPKIFASIENEEVLENILKIIVRDDKKFFYQGRPITLSEEVFAKVLQCKNLATVWLTIVSKKRGMFAEKQIQSFLQNEGCKSLWGQLFHSTVLDGDAQKMVLENGTDADIAEMIEAKHNYLVHYEHQEFNFDLDEDEIIFEDVEETEQTQIQKFVFDQCLNKVFVKSLLALHKNYKDWFTKEAKEQILTSKQPELMAVLDVDDNKTQLRVLKECGAKCFREVCKASNSISVYVSNQVIVRNIKEELLALAEFVTNDEIIVQLCKQPTEVVLEVISNRKESLSLEARQIILDRNIEEEVLFLEDYPYVAGSKVDISAAKEKGSAPTSLSELMAQKRKERWMEKNRPIAYERAMAKKGDAPISHPFPTGYKVITASSSSKLNQIVASMQREGWHIASQPQNGPISTYEEYSKSEYSKKDVEVLALYTLRTSPADGLSNIEECCGESSGNHSIETTEARKSVTSQDLMVAMVTYLDSYVDDLIFAEEQERLLHSA